MPQTNKSAEEVLREKIDKDIGKKIMSDPYLLSVFKWVESVGISLTLFDTNDHHPITNNI